MTTLREALKKSTIQTMKNVEMYSVIGIASNIRETENLCDVTPLSGTKVLDVRLSPVLNSEVGFRVIPKNETTVIITFVNNTDAYIALCHDIEKILVKITDTIDFEISENLFSVKTAESGGVNFEIENNKINLTKDVFNIEHETETFLKVGDSELRIEDDKFTFNSGTEGMVNPSEITTKLNGLVNQILVELGKISVALGTLGGVYVVGTVSTFDEDDFKNDKILH